MKEKLARCLRCGVKMSRYLYDQQHGRCRRCFALVRATTAK